MISETVMPQSVTENRNGFQGLIPLSVIYPALALGHPKAVLDTKELLERIDARGIRNADIARVLDITPSRVTEIKKGERRLQLDEAAKLDRVFGLEPGPQPLPPSVVRLVVRYIANELASETASPSRLEEIAEDVRAFGEFVADPKVRGSVEAAETFFQAEHPFAHQGTAW